MDLATLSHEIAFEIARYPASLPFPILSFDPFDRDPGPPLRRSSCFSPPSPEKKGTRSGPTMRRFDPAYGSPDASRISPALSRAPPPRRPSPLSLFRGRAQRVSPIFTMDARLLHDVPVQVENTDRLCINRSRDIPNARARWKMEKRG